MNGAGKTTTFRMLTGDETPSGGDAFINGASILKDTDRARLDIGYCPQFDALFSKLTADEHLKFYARLKGLDEPSTQEVKYDTQYTEPLFFSLKSSTGKPLLIKPLYIFNDLSFLDSNTNFLSCYGLH